MNTAIIERGLEVIGALVTYRLFTVKLKESHGVDVEKLIKEIEERDREIERLKMTLHATQIRHEHERTKHLRS